VGTEGTRDGLDNCAAASNPDQADVDGDGFGDACDPFPADPDHEQAQCELDLGICVDTGAACGADLTQCETSLATVSTDLEQCLAVPDGDLNHDGEVSVLDLVLLARRLANLPPWP
jgi:hypothetical protein